VQIKRKNLPENKQAALQKWLDASEFSTLIDVIQSNAFENEAKAANAQLINTSGMDAQAKEFIRQANLSHEMIEVLTKLRESKTPFTIVEVKSCPKSQSSTE
jgi:site-specific recombinase